MYNQWGGPQQHGNWQQPHLPAQPPPPPQGLPSLQGAATGTGSMDYGAAYVKKYMEMYGQMVGQMMGPGGAPLPPDGAPPPPSNDAPAPPGSPPPPPPPPPPEEDVKPPLPMESSGPFMKPSENNNRLLGTSDTQIADDKDAVPSHTYSSGPHKYNTQDPNSYDVQRPSDFSPSFGRNSHDSVPQRPGNELNFNQGQMNENPENPDGYDGRNNQGFGKRRPDDQGSFESKRPSYGENEQGTPYNTQYQQQDSTQTYYPEQHGYTQQEQSRNDFGQQPRQDFGQRPRNPPPSHEVSHQPIHGVKQENQEFGHAPRHDFGQQQRYCTPNEQNRDTPQHQGPDDQYGQDQYGQDQRYPPSRDGYQPYNAESPGPHGSAEQRFRGPRPDQNILPKHPTRGSCPPRGPHPSDQYTNQQTPRGPPAEQYQHRPMSDQQSMRGAQPHGQEPRGPKRFRDRQSANGPRHLAPSPDHHNRSIHGPRPGHYENQPAPHRPRGPPPHGPSHDQQSPRGPPRGPSHDQQSPSEPPPRGPRGPPPHGPSHDQQSPRGPPRGPSHDQQSPREPPPRGPRGPPPRGPSHDQQSPRGPPPCGPSHDQQSPRGPQPRGPRGPPPRGPSHDQRSPRGPPPRGPRGPPPRGPSHDQQSPRGPSHDQQSPSGPPPRGPRGPPPRGPPHDQQSPRGPPPRGPRGPPPRGPSNDQQSPRGPPLRGPRGPPPRSGLDHSPRHRGPHPPRSTLPHEMQRGPAPPRAAKVLTQMLPPGGGVNQTPPARQLPSGWTTGTEPTPQPTPLPTPPPTSPPPPQTSAPVNKEEVLSQNIQASLGKSVEDLVYRDLIKTGLPISFGSTHSVLSEMITDFRNNKCVIPEGESCNLEKVYKKPVDNVVEAPIPGTWKTVNFAEHEQKKQERRVIHAPADLVQQKEEEKTSDKPVSDVPKRVIKPPSDLLNQPDDPTTAISFLKDQSVSAPHSDPSPKTKPPFGDSKPPFSDNTGPPFVNNGPRPPRGEAHKPPFGDHGPRPPPFGDHGPRPPPFGDHGPRPPPFSDHGPRPPPFGDHGPRAPPFSDHGLRPPPFGDHGPRPPPFGDHGPRPPPFGDHGPRPPPFSDHGPRPPPFGDHGPRPPPSSHGDTRRPQSNHDGGRPPASSHDGGRPPPFHDGSGSRAPPFGDSRRSYQDERGPHHDSRRDPDHRAPPSDRTPDHRAPPSDRTPDHRVDSRRPRGGYDEERRPQYDDHHRPSAQRSGYDARRGPPPADDHRPPYGEHRQRPQEMQADPHDRHSRPQYEEKQRAPFYQEQFARHNPPSGIPDVNDVLSKVMKAAKAGEIPGVMLPPDQEQDVLDELVAGTVSQLTNELSEELSRVITSSLIASSRPNRAHNERRHSDHPRDEYYTDRYRDAEHGKSRERHRVGDSRRDKFSPERQRRRSRERSPEYSTAMRSPPRRREEEAKTRSRNPPPPPPPNIMDVVPPVPAEEVFFPPGRQSRPEKIVIIIRGLPGSGKSLLAKKIKDFETENGASAPRILSLDDYFLNEKDVYEYEEEMEESYRASMFKAFQRTVSDGWFKSIIVDTVNHKLDHYVQYWSLAKMQGFQVYIAHIKCEPGDAVRNSLHKRSLADIQQLYSEWEPTPKSYIRLDLRGVMQDTMIEQVEMGESDDEMGVELPVETTSSRWDNPAEHSEESMNRMDGFKISKRPRSASPDVMELIKDVTKRTRQGDGKKHIRWADLEERESALKRQKIGFHIGSGWNKDLPELYSASRDNRR